MAHFDFGSDEDYSVDEQQTDTMGTMVCAYCLTFPGPNPSPKNPKISDPKEIQNQILTISKKIHIRMSDWKAIFFRKIQS